MLFVGMPLLVWRGPWWLDGDHLNSKSLESGSAALVTGFRTATVATVAATGAGIALIYTIRNYRLTRRGQVTDRFTKALERLGSGQMYVRIGGILALEQIIQDAPEQATHAAQVLNAFIRDQTPSRTPPPTRPMHELIRAARRAARQRTLSPSQRPTLPDRPGADVQAALTALTRPASRRHVEVTQNIDLVGLHLARANLSGADFTRADLSGADFTRANLSGSDFTRAYLFGSDFTRANLFRADFTRAYVAGAKLTGADLDGSDFTGAYLFGSDFTGADLSGADLISVGLFRADLTGADLSGADFTGADLSGADLTDADLSEARLTDTNLSGARISDAHGLTAGQVASARPASDTRLPAGIASDPTVQVRITDLQSRVVDGRDYSAGSPVRPICAA